MVVNECEHLLKKNNYQTCKVCIHYLYGFRDFLSFNFENWGCLGLLRFMTFPECYHFFSRENLQILPSTTITRITDPIFSDHNESKKDEIYNRCDCNR